MPQRMWATVAARSHLERAETKTLVTAPPRQKSTKTSPIFDDSAGERALMKW
jgi:hypothetical protein